MEVVLPQDERILISTYLQLAIQKLEAKTPILFVCHGEDIAANYENTYAQPIFMKTVIRSIIPKPGEERNFTSSSITYATGFSRSIIMRPCCCLVISLR